MELGLNGKRALVTASSGGIGHAIVTKLAQEGARVVVNGRSHDTVNKAIEDIRATSTDADVEPLVADAGTKAGCDAIVAAIAEVDILVNNLGIYEPVTFFETDDQQWAHMIEVNVMSGVRLSRHYLRGMLARDSGRVVFISSESAINPAPEMAHYSATKTMQLSLSRNLAELTKGSNVTVNAILPGPVRTEGVERFVVDVFKTDFAAAEKRFMSENRPTSLIQRLTRPEEIADAVAFVASPLASAINGAALRIDGGMVRSVF